ncbi:MAG TPA: hypothetical protein EYM98_05325 [Dehalococcoidia bacterium]|nr:hypothetical protein [Dehalococcoidia bacterium]
MNGRRTTRFHFSDHKSDVTVFATGSNLPDVFESLAAGMFRIMLIPGPSRPANQSVWKSMPRTWMIWSSSG